MGKKALTVILLLIAVSAVIVFSAFQGTGTSSRYKNPNHTSSTASPALDESDSTATAVKVTESNPDSQRAANDDDTAKNLQETYAEVSDNSDYPQLQERLDAMRKRQPNRSFDPEQVVETMTQPDAWERVETPPGDLPLTPEEKFDGREFIHFNPLRIETLMPGDTLEIPVWQLGERYTMRVDSAETHPNGSVTWHGHLENFNNPHRVTITVGDGLSLGGIDTPGGHYVLQAHGKSGWIASSETLFKRNESETDMIIPPVGELEGNS